MKLAVFLLPGRSQLGACTAARKGFCESKSTREPKNYFKANDDDTEVALKFSTVYTLSSESHFRLRCTRDRSVCSRRRFVPCVRPRRATRRCFRSGVQARSWWRSFRAGRRCSGRRRQSSTLRWLRRGIFGGTCLRRTCRCARSPSTC